METREYRTVDKSTWGPGPWQDEPDKRQWQDPATGLPCLIVRNPHGSLCGYVGVTEGHPLYGVGYSTPVPGTPCNERCHQREDDSDYESHYGHTPESFLDAHGGITFASECQSTEDESKHVCHVPGEGETDKVWWYGFDCAHAWDLSPGMRAQMKEYMPPDYWERFPESERHETYKDIDYVTQEVTKLAAQLASATIIVPQLPATT